MPVEIALLLGLLLLIPLSKLAALLRGIKEGLDRFNGGVNE